MHAGSGNGCLCPNKYGLLNSVNLQLYSNKLHLSIGNSSVYNLFNNNDIRHLGLGLSWRFQACRNDFFWGGVMLIHCLTM